MYSFRGRPDGQGPGAGLTAVNSMLYGTTGSGGEHADGTVFRVSPSGTEKMLHSFGGSNDS